MDWGVELWDQFENVDKHLQHNIDFGEKYAKFVKERCSIEMEYATKMRKLVKSFQPKKREEDRSMFSTHKAFQSQLSELNDIAGQHETVAEEMMSKVSKSAQAYYNEIKVEKKKLYQDGRHHQSTLDQHERTLDQIKKKFEKEWKECERSESYFQKLDADTNVTKADVEKAKHMWMSRKDTVESCKTDYGAYLQQFNTEQTDHYQTVMPKIFACYRDCDEKGIIKFKDLMVEYAKIEQNVKPIIQKCLDGMARAANAIDAKLDAALVVERLKSGFVPPNDKEFEDFTSPNHGKTNHEDGSDSQRNSLVIGKQPNRKGLSWLFGQKKVAESADFSHLPPEQRRKKLQKQIEEIRKELTKEDDGRKAILKMQDVYRSNPALGDAGSLEGQIKMATQKIDKLQADLNQHEAWYGEASATMKGSPSRPMKVASNEPQKPQPQAQPIKQPMKTESDIKPSLQRDQSFGDDFDEETEPIGTCVALYDFEATSDGALSMTAGQEFSVLEADNGDGWTRAMTNDLDGYVPTSYIEVKFFT